jgi:hypothetical protein
MAPAVSSSEESVSISLKPIRGAFYANVIGRGRASLRDEEQARALWEALDVHPGSPTIVLSLIEAKTAGESKSKNIVVAISPEGTADLDVFILLRSPSIPTPGAETVESDREPPAEPPPESGPEWVPFPRLSTELRTRCTLPIPITFEVDLGVPDGFRSRIPFPVGLWRGSDGGLGEMIGAKFVLRQQGLRQAWIAFDHGASQTNVHLHYVLDWDSTARSIEKAFSRQSSALERMLVPNPPEAKEK